MNEKFEDIRGVIRSRKSEDRQYNGKKGQKDRQYNGKKGQKDKAAPTVWYYLLYIL